MTFSPEELEARRRLRDEFEVYAAACLKIRNKAGDLVPLRLNAAQRLVHEAAEKQLRETGRVRLIVLKCRKPGVSTYVEGRFYWRVTHRAGRRAFILTHEQAATDTLFSMAQRFHEHCPDAVKPSTGAANAKELRFDLLDSGYAVGTAGTKGTGRGGNFHYFHGSEVAHWPNAEEHAAGVIQAVPDEPGTEVILESTANGIGNYFHRMWQQSEEGGNEYRRVFFPWFLQEEYRKPVPEGMVLTPEEAAMASFYKLDHGQIAWRRSKLIELGSEMLFMQENPANSVEAFQTTGTESFISAAKILAARKCVTDPYGPLVVGVDPAGQGKDRTAIAFRRSRKCTKIDSYTKKEPMEIVGICARILKNHQPAAMFIDVGERGSGIVDRLRELGWGSRVFPVNFGGNPTNKKLYKRKKDEMWGLMREWLENQPAQIPDTDELQADLQGPAYTTDSNNVIILEPKDVMKKRGIRSPDLADALALTFAEPIGNPLPPLPAQEMDYFGVNE